jgi:hypothetical protein
MGTSWEGGGPGQKVEGIDELTPHWKNIPGRKVEGTGKVEGTN